MTDARLVTAYSVNNLIFGDEGAAEMWNKVVYKRKKQVKSILAIQFRGMIYPTNPLIVLSEEQHGTT